jgi:hypothetical protein
MVHELKLSFLSVNLVGSQFCELKEFGRGQKILDIVFVRYEHEHNSLGGHLVF